MSQHHDGSPKPVSVAADGDDLRLIRHSDASPDEPGEAVGTGSVLRGRYRLIEVIGRGGMADVYRGTDQVLGREVAVKVFRPGTDRHSDRQRFLGEVHTLAGLTHQHLVALYDGGQNEARPWCVMQLVGGGTLADLEGEQPPVKVASIGAQMADALAHIHARGIVHRDMKPSNVLLDSSGAAYLSDFGVAQLVDATRMTATGALLGTAAYLSPEQVRGRAATPAVDVYALALVMLEAITGRREFPGAPVESAVARLSRSPQVPSELGPVWARLLTSMTDVEPANRPDAASVAGVLRALARGADPGITPVPAQRVSGVPVAQPDLHSPVQPMPAYDPATMMIGSQRYAAPPPAQGPRSRWIEALNSRTVAVLVSALIATGGVVAAIQLLGPSQYGVLPIDTVDSTVEQSTDPQTDAAQQGVLDDLVGRAADGGGPLADWRAQQTAPPAAPQQTVAGVITTTRPVVVPPVAEPPSPTPSPTKTPSASSPKPSPSVTPTPTKSPIPSVTPTPATPKPSVTPTPKPTGSQTTTVTTGTGGGGLGGGSGSPTPSP